MRRWVAGMVLVWGPTVIAGEPPPDLAARAWAVADLVVNHQVNPPARQQMILVGLQSLAKAGQVPEPRALAARVSAIQSPEALAPILREVWPEKLPKELDQTPEEILIDGILAIVPGGAEYLSSKERKVAEQVEGNLYVGIQVALKLEGNRPAFQQILPGGPADKAGARAEDVIDAIDGVSTEGMKMAEVVDRIRGEAGTEVLIRLKRPRQLEPLNLPMIRGTLPRVTVEGFRKRPDGTWDIRLEGPTRIGYLKINEIVGSTPRELRAFAAQLESEDVVGLILDLRTVTNAGFHPTVLLADALLAGGVIGKVQDVDGDRVIQADPDALFRDGPIVVITAATNPAEVQWLCAGLEDNHRAKVIGPPFQTFSDAGVRAMVPLKSEEGAVKMVTGRFLRGNGQPLVVPPANPGVAGFRQHRGMAPQVVPLDPYQPTPVEADRQFPQVLRRMGVIQNPETLLNQARELIEAASRKPETSP